MGLLNSYENFSSIDFHPSHIYSICNFVKAHPQQQTEISERDSGLGGQCMFEHAGIYFGLEVCIDHKMSRLANSIARALKLANRKGVDVHLITSCGIRAPEKTSVAARLNGYVFIADGLQPSTNAYQHKDTAAGRVLAPLKKQNSQQIATSLGTIKDLGFKKLMGLSHRALTKKTRVITFQAYPLPPQQ